jgi:flagellar assembly protein FliH
MSWSTDMTPAKFKFDTEFRDDGDRVSMAARARAKKPFSQDEIDQMCAKARAEGSKAGEARALEAVAAATRDMAQVLRQALTATHDDIETLRKDAAELAVAAARKLAALAVEALPSADVEETLRNALHQAIGEPRIVLRASPRVIEALNERLTEIAHEEGFDGRVVASADAAIKGADCRIEWRGGGMERSEAAIEAAIGALIARRFSGNTNSKKDQP